MRIAEILFNSGVSGLSSIFVTNIMRAISLRPRPRKGELSLIGGAIVDSFNVPNTPSIFINYDNSSGGPYIARFDSTIREASQGYNKGGYNDNVYFSDPKSIFDNYKKKYEGKVCTVNRKFDYALNPLDFEILKIYKLIPKDFKYENITYVRSNNGANSFAVGYSQPFNISTNRDKIKVIKPLWAVSMGTSFDASGRKYSGIQERDFDSCAMSMLYAEWLLNNVGMDGCHKDQSLILCNAERAEMINLMIERLRIKQAKFDDSFLSYDDVFTGKGQKWNAHPSFMDKYNQKKKPTEVVKRFNEFNSSSAYWPMPNLFETATHFIHPWSMSKGGKNPSWSKSNNPFSGNPVKDCYVYKYPVLIGKSVFTDRSMFFK